jgi:hypothetical protein
VKAAACTSPGLSKAAIFLGGIWNPHVELYVSVSDNAWQWPTALLTCAVESEVRAIFYVAITHIGS